MNKAPPALWSGKQKLEATQLLWAKTEELGIVPYRGKVTDYKIHKNVRVH